MRVFTSSTTLVCLGLLCASFGVAFPADPADSASFRQGVAGQIIHQSVTLDRDIRASEKNGIVVGADGVVLDCAGHSITGDGTGNGVESIDRRNVTITNCVIEGFEKGIYLASSDGRKEQLFSVDNVVRNNKLTANEHAVFLMWSHRARISGNEIVGNTDSGISLTGHRSIDSRCSNGVTLSGNEVSFNRRGLVTFCSYKPQEGNVVEDNTFSHNVVSVTDRFEELDRITYSANTFDDNLTTVFFRYRGDHQTEPGTPREFDIAVYRSDGEECTDFEIESVETSPDEPVSVSKTGNRVVGSFKPRRDGLYSLGVAVRGCGQDLIRQRFWFGTEKTETYYLDLGRRNDVGNLIGTPPARSVRVYCTMWIEAGVELAPKDPGIAKITGFRSSMWSNYFPFDKGAPYENLWGIEFDHTFSRRGDAYVAIDGKHEKGRARVAEEITKGPFVFDRSDWLDLAVKYWGRDPDWTSQPGALSRVEVSYVVSDAPLIESISNRGVRVLSATSSPGTAAQAEIVLQGKGTARLSVRMGDATQLYELEVDGVACTQSSTCGLTQDGATLVVDLELSGHVQTITVAGKQEPKKASAT